MSGEGAIACARHDRSWYELGHPELLDPPADVREAARQVVDAFAADFDLGALPSHQFAALLRLREALSGGIPQCSAGAAGSARLETRLDPAASFSSRGGSAPGFSLDRAANGAAGRVSAVKPFPAGCPAAETREGQS